MAELAIEVDENSLEIVTNGITVWINRPEGLIGRLGPRGIDVHATPGDMTHCLDCRALPDDPWRHFVASMKQHHGVDVPDRFCPRWARGKGT